jgi:hypothetical protein
MPRHTATARVLQGPADAVHPFAATLMEAAADGSLIVQDAQGRTLACDWLQAGAAPLLAAGDRLLVQPLAAGQRAVVLGRIGRYEAPAAEPAHLQLHAREALSLHCGEASLELRANGQVLLKGEDVLLRAKGTQRIRAGTVSIN